MITTPSELAPYIDHTLLKADTSESDIRRICQEARTHSFKAVCVNPTFVALACRELQSSSIMTASVVGFPLGTHATEVKALEAERAVQDGASEIDMVVRIDLVKAGAWREVEKDIAGVVRASGPAGVKVILETGLLTQAEIENACRASEGAGAAFVKTATGFIGRGATIEDVKIMRSSCGPGVRIKASGGIKSFSQAVALVAAGADRLGTSSGVLLVTGQDMPTQGY